MFTHATDQYPNNVNKHDIDRVLASGRSETGGLDYELHWKEIARVMLTANIDISDRLVSGQIGTVVVVSKNEEVCHKRQPRRRTTTVHTVHVSLIIFPRSHFPGCILLHKQPLS